MITATREVSEIKRPKEVKITLVWAPIEEFLALVLFGST